MEPTRLSANSTLPFLLLLILSMGLAMSAGDIPEAVSRELSVFLLAEETGVPEGISREVSLFLPAEESIIPEAISRELSVFLPNAEPLPDPEAISREVSLFLPAEDVVVPEGISREVSLFIPDPIAPPSGLFAWWPGEDSALDFAGTNHGVTFGATSFRIAYVGNGFHFEQDADYTQLPDVTHGMPVGTLEAWVRTRHWDPKATVAGQYFWASSRELPGASEGFDGMSLGSHPASSAVGELMFGIFETNAPSARWHWANSGLVPEVDRWYHVAASWGDQGIRLYIDGQLKGSDSYTGSAPSFTRNGIIGRSSWPGSSCLGDVDELKIFNRALTPAEITALYNAGASGINKTLTPPYFLEQPQNLVTQVTREGTLTSIANGAAPLSFRWFFQSDTAPTNDAPWSLVSASTNGILHFDSLEFANAGRYYVQVSNVLGVTASRVVSVTLTNPACVAPPSGLVGWWPGEGDAKDLTELNSGTLQGNVTFDAGIRGKSYRFEGNGEVLVPDSDLLRPRTLTVQAWVKPEFKGRPRLTADADIILSKYDDTQHGYILAVIQDSSHHFSDAPGFVARGTVVFQANIDGVVPGAFSQFPLPDDGQFHLISGTYDGATFSVYIDGILAGTRDASGSIVHSMGPILIGAIHQLPIRRTVGQIDELAIFNRALSSNEIAAIYAAGSAGMCKPTVRCVPPPSGLVGWWPADGSASNVMNGAAGVPRDGAAYATGITGQSFHFDGKDDAVVLPGTRVGALDITGNQLTIAAWINLVSTNQLYGNSQTIFDKWFDGHPNGYYLGVARGTLGMQVATTDGIVSPLAHIGLQTQRWTHVAGTYDGANVRLFMDGVEVGSGALTGNVTHSEYDAAIGNDNGGSSEFGLNGLIDELGIFNRALSSNEIAAIYAAGSAGMCKPHLPPQIVVQPTNVTVFASQPAELRVGVVGDEPLRYQWRFNGAALAQGTNATLSFPAALPTLAGDYDVVVANPLASVTSVVVHLTVRTDIPDLAAQSVRLPANSLAGRAVSVVYSIANLGSGTAAPPWVNVLELVSGSPDRATRSLGAVTQFSALEPGSSLTMTQSVILPSDLLGTWFPSLTVDSANQVFETVKANNVYRAPESIQITAPDLEVGIVTTASNAVFGQGVNVRYWVRNRGTARTFAPWSDALWFSQGNGSVVGASVLADAAAPFALDPGQSYTNTARVTLPFKNSLLPSNYFILVQADAGKTQPESDESNNLTSLPITLIYPPRPDLLISSLSSVTNAAPGQTIAVTWTVTNAGPAAALAPWTESIQIVGNDITNISNPTEFLSRVRAAATLGTYAFSNALAPGEFIVRTQFVSLPLNGLSGDTRLIATVDARDEVFEEDETNNVSLASALLRVPRTLSLQLSSSQIAEEASVPLRATLTRNGSLSEALSVSVSNSDPSELSFVSGGSGPASTNVTIPSGQSVLVLNLYPVQDHVVDAQHTVTVAAAAAGYESASATVAVLNSDLPTLSLSTEVSSVSEGATLAMTVKRDFVTPGPVLVSLISSSPGQLSPPTVVTIPGGQSSTTFAVLAVDDVNAEAKATYSVSASAPGFNSGVTSVEIMDNDVPELTVSLSTHSISEGAGAQALSMTVTRNPVGQGALNIEPFARTPSLLNLPLRITIPAGQASRSFPIGVLDDGLDNGPRSTTVGAYALAAGSGAHLSEAIPDTLTVTDDDGSTLKLVASAKLVREGLNPATTLILTRNTPATNDLQVTLISSRPGEATLPATVILPVGATSISVPLVSVSDGVPDGNQSVILTASAPDFTSASETVVVSDTDLPDLLVASINAPSSGTPLQTVSVSYRVANQGLSSSQGEFRTRVYLSKDPLIGDDILVAQSLNSSGLEVGKYFEATEQITLPATVGSYWVVVETDAESVIPEVLENNNSRISTLPIVAGADYGAWVRTDVVSTNAGASIPLYGRATNELGAGVAGKTVNLHLLVRGIQRVLSATTDASGNFAATFVPLPGEAGRYDIFATHPGVGTVAVQDSFSLQGFRANPSSVALTVVEGTTRSGTNRLENLSDVAMTGVKVEVIAKPANLGVTADVSSGTIAGSGISVLNYSVTATTADAYGTVQLRVTTAEGLSQDVYLGVSVEPLRPRLVVAPVSLYAAMPVGGQAVVEFDISNLGGRESGPITLSLPGVPWMHLATTNPMPSLAPGQTNHVTLVLTPATNLALGPYTGSLAVNASNAGTTIPFNFRAMSVCLGDLMVDVVDEFTYYAEGAPHVAGATVTLRDSYTLATVTNAVTGTNGQVRFKGLNEGYYDIVVTADKHTSYQATHLLKAGLTNEMQVFASRQTVTYTWTVEPVALEDRYRVTVETTFETVVPAPVVVIEPSVIDLSEFQQEESQVIVRVTNHGLITAQNFKLTFDSHPLWDLKPIVENLGDLAARTSISIPVTIRRKHPTSAPALGSLELGVRTSDVIADAAPCVFPGRATWTLPCGKSLKNYAAPLTAINAGTRCGGGGPAPSGGGGGGTGGGSGVAGSGNADPVINAPTPVATPPCCGRPQIQWLSVEPNGSDDSFATFRVTGGDLSNAILAIGPGEPVYVGDLTPGDHRVPFNQNAVLGAALGGGGSVKFSLYGSTAACGKFEKVSALPESVSVEAHQVKLAGTATGDLQAKYFFKFERSFESSKPDYREIVYPVPIVNQKTSRTIYLESVRSRLLPLDASTTLRHYGEVLVFSDASGKEALNGSSVLSEIPTHSGLVIDYSFNRWVLSSGATVEVRDGVASITTPLVNFQFSDIDVQLKGSTVAHIGKTASLTARGISSASSLVARSSTSGAESNGSDGGICARVRLRLEQEAVIARDAFRATLELDNNGPSRLENVLVSVAIRPESGLADTSLFSVRSEGVTTLSAVDGSGILAGNSTGTAKWLIIPTVDAAPTTSTRFLVGGTLSYRLDGNTVTVPLSEVPITVLPSPRLTLKYFPQRDVFSDDPFTPLVEPSVPYSLAVMVQNNGYGLAKNFRINSAQPKIVENEKGLLIDFNIIATELFKTNVVSRLTPSLTANFGDITAGDTAVGRWLMTSTLQGLFIDYKATWEHIDGLGNPRLSLIDEVTIHEMNHLVQAGGVWEDGKPDFLVNQRPDVHDYPDALYQSNGSTNFVDVVEQGTFTGTLSPGNLKVTLNAPMPVDWAYLRLPDPGNGLYRLTRVMRSDDVEISVNTNVWTTDRTFIGKSQAPVRENILHLLDYNSPGTYTLTYEPGGTIVIDTNAPVSAVASLPAASRPYFQVSWSGKDLGSLGETLSGIAYYDIYVSENDGPFVPWLQKTTLVSATYIGKADGRYAFYSIATDANGNREAQPTQADAQTAVSLRNQPPTILLPERVVIDEGQVLDLPFTVNDPDVDQSLSVALGAGAPAGVVLDGAGRRLSWPTGEGNGPSTNVLTLIVSDNDFESLSTTGRVTVVVNEVNTPPTLDPIEDARVSEGQLLSFKVNASDRDVPTQPLRFSLGVGAPAGASVGSASGVFTWRPSDIQGGKTNRITVIVQDSGQPSLSASQFFDVAVRDTSPDFELRLGSTNVVAGGSNQVPVRLHSGLELTALNLRVPVGTEVLTNFSLGDIAPEIRGAVLTPEGSNGLRLELAATPGQLLPGDGVLATLRFSAPPQEHSAIVQLPVSELKGSLLDGRVLLNGKGLGGRVFVIADEPLLDSLLDSNGTRSLVLYGQQGDAYEIQSTTNLATLPIWQPVRSIILTNNFDTWSSIPALDPQAYYRALQLPSPASVRIGNITQSGDGRIQFEFAGVSNRLYVVEASTNLIHWQSLSTNAAPVKFIAPAGTTPLYRFFRVRQLPLCLPPPKGLIAWWPGDGNSRDVVGTNHGTLLNGVGFAPGAVGQGFKFDGVNDYINLGRASQLRFAGTNSFSFSFWMAPENTGSPADIITRFNIGTGVAWELYSGQYSQVSFWTRAAAVPQDLTSSPTVPYGQFTHVAMTYDGTSKHIYLNGKLDSSIPSAPMVPFHDEDVDVLIGVRFISGQPYFPNAFKGVLDEIQVFDRALTSEDVRYVYQAGGAGLCIP